MTTQRRGFVFFKRTTAVVLALLLLFSAASAQPYEGLRVLLIGVDARSADQPGRSDAMMLAQISPSGEVRLASFLRDLYVSIPGHGKNRLNAAYFYGGEDLLKQTFEKNFGITVDRTVTVDFSVLSDLVDELGGVQVDITQAELAYLNQLLKDHGRETMADAGLQRLDGFQALCYSRLRKLDGDFQRTSRQHTLIAAMLQQMAQLDRWTLLKLAVKNISRVQTDLSLGDLTQLAPLIAKLDEAVIRTAHVPFEGAFSEETVNGMMVLSPDLKRCRARLEAFLTEE